MQMNIIAEQGTGIALSGEAFATNNANFSESDIEKLKAQ